MSKIKKEKSFKTINHYYAFLFFNFLNCFDIVTTLIGLSVGANEINPIFLFFGNIYNFLSFKLLLIFILSYFMYFHKSYKIKFLLFIFIVYNIVIINNIIIIGKYIF